MPKEEWGVKRACPKCAVRFYDLQNDPMTCPSCGFEFTLESLIEAAKSRGVVKGKEAGTKDAKAPDEDLDVVLDDDDDETDSTVGDDLLDDDDDDDTASLDEIADVAKEEDDS